MNNSSLNSNAFTKNIGFVRNLNSLENVFLKNVLNNNLVATSISRFSRRLNNEFLKDSIAIITNHNELLKACVSESEGGVFINYKDFSTVHYEYRESDFPIKITNINIREITGMDSNILTIILNNYGDSSDIVTCFNHVLFDGISLDYIMDDIYRVYISLEEGHDPKIKDRRIDYSILEQQNVNINNEIFYDYFLNLLQRYYNILFQSLVNYNNLYLDECMSYLKDTIYKNTESSNRLNINNNSNSNSNSNSDSIDYYFNLIKDYKVNSFDKLDILETNKRFSKIKCLTTISLPKNTTSNVLKNIELHKISLFSYVSAVVCHLLKNNYSTQKYNNIQILTFLNLRYLKHFDYSYKHQGLLAFPLYFNVNTTDKDNIWEQGREIYEYIAEINEKANPSTISAILDTLNNMNSFFYKTYLDLTKFETRYIDIQVNYLGVIKNYKSLHLNKSEVFIHNETELIPKLHIYLYILRGQLFISISSAFIHESNHTSIVNDFKSMLSYV